MLKRFMVILLMLVASMSMAQGFSPSGGGGITQATLDSAIAEALADITHGQTWSIPFTNAPSPAPIGGFYEFSSTDVTFNPAATWGIVNVAKGAHFMVVCAAGATDTELTVTGTSVTDDMVRTENDTEVLALIDDTEGAYYETSKKWNGELTVEKTAGTDRLVNYGWCKYWDNRNKDFRMVGGEATWMGDKAATIDIILLHHKTTGWTYSSTTVPTPPTPLLRLSDAYGSDDQVRSDVKGVFKAVLPVGVLILGSESEGVIVNFEFDVGGCIEYGQTTMDFKNVVGQ